MDSLDKPLPPKQIPSVKQYVVMCVIAHY